MKRIDLMFAALVAAPALLGSEGIFPAEPGPGYRGIWFTLGGERGAAVKYSGGLGTYTANHHPMAVYSREADTTFFTYGGTPAADRRELQIMVGAYDHARRRLSRPGLVLAKAGINDPHDNASLNLDAAGHVWVFVSGRSTRRPGLIYRSARPRDIARFEQIATQEFTYPQPWWIPGRGWLLLFTKYTAGRELYWKTSADGRTWSADRKLAGFGGHYQTSGQQGGKIATFFNYHPGGDVDRRTNLYYAQSVDGGTTWTTASGTELTLPLAGPQNAALVHELESGGELMFTCDLNFDAAGNPLLLYVVGRDPRPGPHTAPREWRLSRWTGSEWQTHRITSSDHNYDMGSLYVAGAEWRVIAPTAPGPQPHGTGGDMELWVSGDQGRSWSLSRRLTRDSEFNHSYARRPLHARDPFYAFWADGNPHALSPSRLYFSDSSGANVTRLPYTMDGAFLTLPER